MDMRLYSNEVKAGKKVLVKGWVKKIRELGGLIFFILGDREGEIQVTLKKGETRDSVFKVLKQLNREDCVSVEGAAVKSKQAPGGIEIKPSKIELVSKARTPLPIETSDKIDTGFDKRFDYRFIDLRNPKIRAIFRVRDTTLSYMREFFRNAGFIEVNTPSIQAAGAEGGSTLFPILYYNKEAFLRQSPQLYKQILMASTFDKVFEIGPAFRAEKFHTRRHVSEFLSVDFEMSWIESQEDVFNVIENMVAHTIKGVLKECKKELNILGVKDIKVPSIPFKRLTYTDCVDILNKHGIKFKWGDDIADSEEKIIGEYMLKNGHEWFFIKEFPGKLKPFYIMMKDKVSHSFDCVYRGMEIASGGQREHRPEVLIKMIKKKGLNPDNFKFYIDAFTYGMPPHGGMGFGIERMIQQMLRLESIKEAILFPRTPERLLP